MTKDMDMEKEFGNFGNWVRKHAKILLVLAIIYLFVGTPVGETIMGIVNPGFPGAYCATYGANFEGYNWVGANQVHVAGTSETTLLQNVNQGTMADRIYWGDCSPTSLTVVYDQMGTSGHAMGNVVDEQMIETDVQSPIPLAAYNSTNSTPLPLTISNAASWDQGEILSYWNPTGAVSNTVQTLPNGTKLTTTNYFGTMQDLLLIPGNFYISISIPPSRAHAGHDSGWQEGTWSNFDFWYEIYWYNWLNAYSSVLQKYLTSPNATQAPNARAQEFNLVGGYPIQGWIQLYTIPFAGFNLADLQVTDPGTKQAHKLDSIADVSGGMKTLENIEGNIQLSPAFNAAPVVLYTEAGDQYKLPTYNLPAGPIDAQAEGLLHSPDFQTVLPAEFFKIHVDTFGTYTDGGWPGPYTVYYPSVNYLMRFIFAVYGSQPFVWTVQTAEGLGYNATANYQVPPAQWQPRQIINVTGGGLNIGLPSFSWADLFSPLNFEVMAVLIIIVILVVTVFNPGVWANILHKKKED